MKARKGLMSGKKPNKSALKKDQSARIMKPVEPILSAREVMMSHELIAKLSNKPYEAMDLEEKEESKIAPKKGKTQHKRIWAEESKNLELKTKADLEKNSVESWIKRLQLESEKEENEGAFVYLRQADPAEPYTLTYCNYAEVEKAGGRFYTLSKKGFTSYFHSEATEFLTIVEWIMERELYDQIKSFKFFKLFRLWRAIKSWRHNVVADKRKIVKDTLERKLIFTREGFRKLLIEHRRNCKKLETQRIFDITDPDDTLTLKQFEASQENHMKATANRISEVSQKTRDNFMSEITRTLDDLKKKIRETQQQNEEDRETLQKQTAKNSGFGGMMSAPNAHQPESGKLMAIDAVYEHLGFQSNLSYAHRTDVRKECKMFIRFSYLLDFMAKTSLKEMYLNSMQVFNQYMERHNDIRIPMELPILKTTPEFVAEKSGKPIVSLNLSIKDKPVQSNELKYEIVDAYEKPPIGKITEVNFDPTCHLQLISQYNAELAESNPSGRGAYGIKIKSAYVENPYLRWIKLTPEIDDLTNALKRFMTRMLEVVKVYERHSRNENLHPYAGVLEEWDEKVADKWDVTDDKRLSCEDILEEEKEYVERELCVDKHMNKIKENLNKYLILFNDAIIKLWRYSKIPWDLVTDDNLREPVDTITLLVKQIKKHKEDFAFRIPNKADIGFLKLNMTKVREKMCGAPNQALKKLDHLMVFFLNHN